MLETSRHLHFTHSLERFTVRLYELLSNARLHQSNLPPELLDEIAYTTGELTIVLMNHDNYQEEKSIQEVLTLAQTLRLHLRSNQLRGDEITEAFDPFRQKIDRLLSRNKRAA